MNKFGIQSEDKLTEIFSEEKDFKLTEQIKEIRDVLRKFKMGYAVRDIEKIDAFVEELFVIGEDTCILGTGTGELCLGSEQAKRLIEDDWKYWGDVNIDWQKAHIETKNEAAWFAATGSVKYTFEDTPERYDSYLNFIKKKAEEPGFAPKQKIAFINWVLALTYHQRFEKRREYLLLLRLSGVLLKDGDKWKFSQLQFSMPRGNFPDERFENSKEHFESYNNQIAIAGKYYSKHLTIELKALLRNLETELIGQKDISKEAVNRYFTAERDPFIIAPEDHWYIGIDRIKEFFTTDNGFTLSLDLEHAIAAEYSDVTWVTAFGALKQSLTEDELAARVLDDIESLFDADLASKEKLFAVHRSVSWALKESDAGADYTCPIRLTAVILREKQGLVFSNIHFSFPSYWIFEGKINSL